MKKRDVIWLLAIATVAALALLLFRRPDKPFLHQGRNSWQWASDLQSPVPGAREKAIAALNEMGTNAVPMLVRQLEYKESFPRKTRIWLGSHLPGKLGAAVSRGIKPLLIGDIHWVAARGLQVLGTNAASATPALLRAMRTDPEMQVMWDAAGALGAIGAPAVPGLMELLKHPTPRVRHAAAFALGQIGPPALPAASALIRSAADANPDVRNSSLYSLSRIGPTAGMVALKTTEESRGDIRRAAATALVAVHPRGQLTLPVLVEMARDPDPASRAVAIESLTALHITHTNAMAVYVVGLSDSNAAVRFAAAKAIGAAAHKAKIAKPILERLQRDDPEESVRVTAAEALEKLSAIENSSPRP